MSPMARSSSGESGNAVDSQTVQSQITQIKERFALDRAIFALEKRVRAHILLSMLTPLLFKDEQPPVIADPARHRC